MHAVGPLVEPLVAQRELILADWQRALARPDGAGPALPLEPAWLLDRLLQALGREPETLTGSQALPALVRWPAGSSLSAIVRGLRLLRHALIEACGRLGPPAETLRESVHAAIDTAIEEAVAQRAPADPPPTSTTGTAASVGPAQADESRFVLATTAFPGVVYDYDVRSRRVVRSVGLERLTGYRVDEIDETGPDWWFSLLHPDDLAQAQRAMATCIEQQSEACESEYRIRHRDGSWRWVWDRSRLLYDAGGHVVRLVGITLDIHDRKQAEEALRVEEMRFRATFETSAIGIGHIGLDGRFLRVNAQLGALLGIAPEDLVGRNFRELTHPDDLGASEARVEALLAGQLDAYHIEKRYLRSDGRPVWLNVTVSLARDPRGRPLYAISFYENIDQRRQAESILARYRLLSRHGRDIILFMRPEDGRIIEANEAAVRAYGYDRATLLRLSIAELRAGEARQGVAEQLQAASQNDVLFETLHQRCDGRVFPVEVSARGAEVGGQRLVVSIIRDISERCRVEAALRENVDRLRLATEATGLGTWDWELSTGQLTWSNQCRAIFGVGPDEPLDFDWFLERVDPEDRPLVLREVQAAFEPEGAGFYELEFRARRIDGTPFWVSARGRCHFEGQGAARRAVRMLGTALDVTRRKELEAELTGRRAAAEAASRHKTRLLTALSHDVRTPLNAVVLSAELLELHVQGSAHPEVRDCLQTIRHSVRNVLDLLNDLLDLTRIEAGVMPLEPSRFPLVPALVECFASVEAQARRQGLEPRLAVEPLEGLVVETDRAKLKQIVSNFLSNALRYTERGSLTLRGERRGDQVVVAVEDTGPGIAPADQARIFDEFTRLPGGSRAAGEGGEGLGLGLAICQRLAGLLGARIELRSAPGQGSGFQLVLPCPSLDGSGTAIAARPATPVPVQAAGAILIAEDHEPSRQMLARVLRRLGYRVVEACHGREALDQIDQARPLALLLDVNMPVLDGLEVLDRLRAHPPWATIPVLAISGDVTPANRARIEAAGVSGILSKPVTIEDLKAALARIGVRP